MSSTAPSRPLASPAVPPAWSKAYRDLSEEHGYRPLEVEGTLPDALRGTLVRVGPVRFGVGGERYGHWFDGDGGALAVRFTGGGAQGAVRTLDTPSIRAERDAGKALYTNYGTSASSLWRRLFGEAKNTANTSAFAWNGRLFALVESTRPTELSLEDLSTLGETDLGGVLGPTFSAHPHPVAARRASYNFGIRYGRVCHLDLYALSDAGDVRSLGSVPLPGPVLVHDFVATEHHLVVFLAPVRLHVFRAMLGLGSVSDNLQWRPALGTEVIVIPIDAPHRVARFQAEPFFAWHFGNAFEEGGRIVVDFVRYPDFTTNQWLAEQPRGWARTDAQGRLVRATLDVKAGTLQAELVSDRRCEFPSIHPHRAGGRHRYLYLAGHGAADALRGPQDVLLKVDMDTGAEQCASLGDGHYPSEPVFVPRPGGTAEDDGWLLVQTYDAARDRTYVAVLEAHAPTSPPLARVWLAHSFPFTFHGTWIAAR